MCADSRPCLGLLQSHLGPLARISFPLMKRTTKSDYPPAHVRVVLAKNVAMLRDWKYARLPSATQRDIALAADCKPTSKSQIQRIVKGTLAAGVDIVERLADAFGVNPQDLLTPYFASAFLADKAAVERGDSRELHQRRGQQPPSGS